MKEAHHNSTPWLPFDSADADALRARVADLEAERSRLIEHVMHLERVAHAGLMTSGLTHDLLNQLTGVLGAAEIGLMHGHPEALREGLRSVLSHAGRMNETMDAFLSFVRRREHRVRLVPVGDVVESVRQLLQTAARAESVVLLSTVASHASVRADRQLLEQAVVNVVLNAIRAAARGGGRVVLTAADGPDDRVRISVRDTGPGIREDVRGRLFEPFVTGHAESGGNGIGLFVVRQVVERYGGVVAVETSAAGTRIDLDLPAARQGIPGGLAHAQ